jgi:hypothetical protein
VAVIVEIFRLLVVVFLILHGLGHIIWFLASWTKHKAGIGDGPWLLPGDFSITSVPGRLIGLLALFVLALFLVSALALLLNEPWWRGSTQIAVFLSLLAVFSFARVSPRSNTINAIAADLALLFLVSLPLSVELIEQA